MAPTIEKRSFDRQAADWIRDSIVSGEFSLGQKLTEVALADRIGLSRSTVRTAMQSMVREGFLVQHPYSGWEVVSLSPQDAWELHTLRSNLEGMAARLAAERLDAKGSARLSASLDQLRHAIANGDSRRIAEADLAVHQSIVAVAGHQRLAAQYQLVSGPTLLYILSTNRMMEQPEAIVTEHEGMIQAILKQNADEAEHLAKLHVTSHGARLVEELQLKQDAVKAVET